MKIFGLILLIGCYTMSAQDSADVKKIQYKGYVKDMQTLSFANNLSNLTTGNLIHNRFNVKMLVSDRITGAVEFRNRLFWGEEVQLIPEFSSQLRNRNEAVRLTWNPVDERQVVLNTTIDRLWVEYRKEKWNVRLGRQRINWCIGTTWNANDLFNTYNFLDFDYEERPGADGVKLQYFTGEMDHLEFAASINEKQQIISAIRYFKNIADYDIQLIAGSYDDQPTVGLGWSGSIRETGFKGEVEYFFEHGIMDDQVNLVVEADHVFKSGLYVNGGFLLNNRGIAKSLENASLAALQFSPRTLMPTRSNCLLSVSKEITPLTSITSSLIYSPGPDLLLLLPSINHSLSENLDVSLVWQSFFSQQGSSFDDLSHRCFIRFKWSY